MKFNPQPKQGPKPKKAPKPLKRTPLKRSYKPSGEKEIFEEVLNAIPYDSPTRCFVCGIKIALVTHCNFAHVLSKKQYPRFKLEPANIVLLCHRIVADENGFQGCHFSLDHTPHSKLKGEGWEKLFDLRERLKEAYPDITKLK